MEADVVCVFHPSSESYSQIRSWLGTDPKRRAVFISEAPESSNDPRIQTYVLETPLQIEPLAKQVAWHAALARLAVIPGSPSPWFASFKTSAEECHVAANLLLTDSSDWGCSLLVKIPGARSALALKGRFPGVPAIICGAGPSLQLNGHLLKDLQDRALLFAAGNAWELLAKIGAEPHFAGAVDKYPPPSPPFPVSWKTPLFCQSRTDRTVLASRKGEKLYLPDGLFPFDSWLSGFDEPFEAGWTVGNVLMRCAAEMGCDPIIFVGMDFADREGNTRRDWPLAVQWTEQFAKRFPNTRWINATEGGVGFQPPIVAQPLREALLPLAKRETLRNEVKTAVEALPKAPFKPERLRLWQKSLKRCRSKISPDEIVYQKLLEPLWRLWKPLFERESTTDGHALPLEEKLQMHQNLFFQQIVQDHV